MLHLRPRNRFEDLDGVYLVGGGTHPGSGLPVIFEIGPHQQPLLLDDFGIDGSWIDVGGDLESSRMSAAQNLPKEIGAPRQRLGVAAKR